MVDRSLFGEYRWAPLSLEPLAFHKREGLWWKAPPVNYKDWYIRGHSEEIIKALADLGINLVSTHFFKGYGMQSDLEDLKNTERLIKNCHRQGIKVLLYVQMSSLFMGTFSKEISQARDWLSVDPEGKPIVFGGITSSYHRLVPCKNNPAFIEYIKEVFRKALVEFQGDGIHLDNLFLYPNACYCQICKKKFREYLNKEYTKEEAQELFGFYDFSYLDPPPTFRNYDPVSREWVNFKCDGMRELLEELKNYAKSLKPDSIFNAHAPYAWHMSGDYLLKVSTGPETISRNLDMVVAENYDFPRISDHGELISMIREYKLAFINGHSVMSFAFLPAEGRPPYRDGGITFIPTSAEAKLALGELAAFGGHVSGGFWITMPDKGRFAFEDENLNRILKEYYNFLSTNKELFINLESYCETATLRPTASLMNTYDITSPCVTGMEQLLIQEHIPFDIILERHLNITDLARYQVLILPNVTCMTDEQVDTVKQYVDQGGSLVVIGDTSLYNQNMQYRDEYGLAELMGISRLDDKFPPFLFSDYGQGKVLYFSSKDFLPGRFIEETRMYVPSLPRGWKDKIRLIKQLHKPFLITNAPETLVINTFTREKELLVHLLNYRVDQEVKDLNISISIPSGKEVQAITHLSPDDSLRERLSFKHREDKLRFRIPKVEIYSVVKLTYT